MCTCQVQSALHNINLLGISLSPVFWLPEVLKMIRNKITLADYFTLLDTHWNIVVGLRELVE